MNDKKTQLIQAAIKLFGEHDYHTTSVQDIVSLAGVSKGAFYQHFQSKEELLSSIFIYYCEKIQNGLIELSRSPLSSKDKIAKGLQIQCNLLHENKDILNMIVKGTAFGEKLISDMLLERQLEITQWFQERIIEQYGSDIEAHSLDCAIMLNGGLKHILFFSVFYGLTQDSSRVAEFLVDRLDNWIDGVRQKQSLPLFPAQFIHNYCSQKVESAFHDSIHEIAVWIQSHVEDKTLANTMLQCLEAITCEFNKEQCNRVIIQGMCSYLTGLSKNYGPLMRLLEQAFSSRVSKPSNL